MPRRPASRRCWSARRPARAAASTSPCWRPWRISTSTASPITIRSARSWARCRARSSRKATPSNAPTGNGSRSTCPRPRSSGKACWPQRGRSSWRRDPRFAERLERIKHQDDLIEILTPVFLTKSRDANGATCCSPTRCPIRPPTTPTRRWRTRRRCTCNSRSPRHRRSLAPTPPCGRPTVSTGSRTCTVSPPPVLDEHGPEIRAELQRRKAS
jgi:hypothetical protein